MSALLCGGASHGELNSYDFPCSIFLPAIVTDWLAVDHTSPEWDGREKAQKAQRIRLFAPFAPFRGHLDRVLSR